MKNKIIIRTTAAIILILLVNTSINLAARYYKQSKCLDNQFNVYLAHWGETCKNEGKAKDCQLDGYKKAALDSLLFTNQSQCLFIN